MNNQANSKWEKMKQERVFDGFAKIDKTTFKMPDGKLKAFDIKTTDHNVVSVFGLTEDKQAILVKQFRPGPEKVFYEFCLGFIEKGESPQEAAEREFLEETGYKGKFHNTGVTEYVGGYRTAATYCFVALDCEKVTDELKLDESEFIEVCLFPINKVRQMLRQGEVRNFGQGYSALDHLGLL